MATAVSMAGNGKLEYTGPDRSASCYNWWISSPPCGKCEPFAMTPQCVGLHDIFNAKGGVQFAVKSLRNRSNDWLYCCRTRCKQERGKHEHVAVLLSHQVQAGNRKLEYIESEQHARDVQVAFMLSH